MVASTQWFSQGACKVDQTPMHMSACARVHARIICVDIERGTNCNDLLPALEFFPSLSSRFYNEVWCITNFVQPIVRGRYTSQKSSDTFLDTQLTDMRYSRTRHWSSGWNLPSLIYILASKWNFQPRKTRLQKQRKQLEAYWFQSHFQAQWRGCFYFIKNCITPFIMRFCCLSFLHCATK